VSSRRRRRTTRKGFAGSKLTHSQQLNRRIEYIGESVVAAGKALRADDCVEAFDKLLSGYANAEIANTEKHHARSDRYVARAGLDDLLGRFVKQCVRRR